MFFSTKPLATMIVGSAVLLFSSVFMPTANAVVVSYTATSADVDSQASNSGGGHSLWLPFAKRISDTALSDSYQASDFDFSQPGILSVDDYGNATLTGTIQSDVDPRFAFDIVFNFSRVDGAGVNGAKRELLNGVYVENGGAIDTSTYDYFALDGGSISGVDEFYGLNFDVGLRNSDTPYPLQLGLGANGKNFNLGASVWYSLYLSSDCSSDFCEQLEGTPLFGDINVDLQVAPVPVPAAFWLFGTGLAGFGAMRRKKNKSVV